MSKIILSIAMLLASISVAFAHGWNDPHQSYQVQEGAKTVYIQLDINNYRKDVKDFYLTLLEDGEQVEFASQQRTYTSVYGSRPISVGIYVRNDRPLPRKIYVCSNSFGDNLDDTGAKKAINIRSRVCALVLLRSMESRP